MYEEQQERIGPNMLRAAAMNISTEVEEAVGCNIEGNVHEN
jgi:hypothetical protein